MSFHSSTRTYTVSTQEFVALMACLMSVVAIAIDAMLPALGTIAQELRLANPNQAQLIVSALFLGLALGQLVCGPLSDATGRKPTLYAGVALFLLGSVVCMLATDLPTLLLGRFVQGLGVSGPYVAAVSVVRDQFSGAQMAKVMSFVMLIFITVPALAPTLGQAILAVASWRHIFGFCVVYALAITVWIYLRLEETLPAQKRIAFTAQGFLQGFATVLRHRATMTYTVCMGLLFGSFLGYLNSSQQIFQVQFGVGHLFALYFGLLAVVFGAASLANARFVERLGPRAICNGSCAVVVLSSALFLALHALVPIALWMFLAYAAVLFFGFGLIFGNLNAMAMEPMGAVAGIASAVIGSLSSLLSLGLGTAIGQMFNNTLIPVTSGFLVLGSAALVLMRTVQRQPSRAAS